MPACSSPLARSMSISTLYSTAFLIASATSFEPSQNRVRSWSIFFGAFFCSGESPVNSRATRSWMSVSTESFSPGWKSTGT